jgi:hypothetical protein
VSTKARGRISSEKGMRKRCEKKLDRRNITRHGKYEMVYESKVQGRSGNDREKSIKSSSACC